MITEFMPRGSLRKILDDKHVDVNHDMIVKVSVVRMVFMRSDDLFVCL